jgi:hypothetical protein
MIKKFRYEFGLVEAVRWDATQQTWEDLMNMDFEWGPGEMGSRKFYINNNNVLSLVSFGDWVIKDANGKCYPCKPDVFEKTYKEVK